MIAKFRNFDKVGFSEIRSDKIQKTLGWKADTKIKEILEMYFKALSP